MSTLEGFEGAKKRDKYFNYNLKNKKNKTWTLQR